MSDVGIIVGRFQVDALHPGHLWLINTAFKNHRKVIIFIGCPPREGIDNPLLYPVRERMIRAEFPEAFVLPLEDKATDKEWSIQIDKQIGLVFPGSKAVLYGGRDSFVPHYLGEHQAVEIDSEISYMSGTQLRKDIGKSIRSSADFRAGIIYASQNTKPRPTMCVDVALLRKVVLDPSAVKREDMLDHYELLMGAKEWDPKWRLPGGKVDVDDKSLELAARRELQEETGLSVEGKLTYLGSDIIRDWRDGGRKDAMYMSALFLGHYTFGAATPGSDLKKLKWVPLHEALEHSNDEGKVLIEKLLGL